MASRSFCWTLNNYTPDEIKLLEKFVTHPLHRYTVWGKEIGEKDHTPHLQGYTELTRPMRMVGLKKLMGLPRVHVESRRGTRDQARDYCMAAGDYAYKLVLDKEHTFVTYGSWEAGGQGSRTISEEKEDKKKSQFKAAMEALAEGADWHDMLEQFPAVCIQHRQNILGIIRDRDTELSAARAAEATLDELKELRTWQTDLKQILDNEPDKRGIWWICDPIGNAGKTSFARWYKLVAGDSWTCQNGRTQDIAFAYRGQRVIFIDLPRSSQEVFNYEMLEKLKDGCIFSAKYESVTKEFPTPHVIVFANWMPDTSKISYDRWHIWTIEDAINYRPIKQIESPPKMMVEDLKL